MGRLVHRYAADQCSGQVIHENRPIVNSPMLEHTNVAIGVYVKIVVPAGFNPSRMLKKSLGDLLRTKYK